MSRALLDRRVQTLDRYGWSGGLNGARWRYDLLAWSTYAEAVKADGPVAYWRLGEASGTVAVDEMSAHTGTYQNAPTLGVAGALTGDADKAVDFTGSAPVRLLDITGYTTMPAVVSIEAWVKAASFSDMGLAGWRSDGNLTAWIYLSSGTHIDFYSGQTGVGAVGVGYDPGASVNTGWHHVVATNDGGLARLYYDGALVAGPTTAPYSGGTSASNFTIANYGGSLGSAFNGSIDEVAVYNTALSDAQVLAHFVAGGGVVAASAVADYPFIGGGYYPA